MIFIFFSSMIIVILIAIYQTSKMERRHRVYNDVEKERMIHEAIVRDINENVLPRLYIQLNTVGKKQEYSMDPEKDKRDAVSEILRTLCLVKQGITHLKSINYERTTDDVDAAIKNIKKGVFEVKRIVLSPPIMGWVDYKL